MYRKLCFLFLCFGQSLTAPQQGGIETIADVKPTIFDYPAEVYDLPAPFPSGESPINGGRQDFSADDINYSITTENINIDTTDYNEEIDGYDRITESVVPSHDYESGENTAEVYSKLGYFINYLPGHNMKDTNGNRGKDVDKSKYEVIRHTSNVKTNNSTKDNPSTEENATTNSHAVDSKTILEGDKNTSDAKSDAKQNQEDHQKFLENTPNYIKNIANIVEDKSNYVSKPSYFSTGRKETYSTANSILKASKRKFRSNCRCEKIWNCPKLQISVPRCPNEYFMCCF